MGVAWQKSTRGGHPQAQGDGSGIEVLTGKSAGLTDTCNGSPISPIVQLFVDHSQIAVVQQHCIIKMLAADRKLSLTANPHPPKCRYSTLESAMNIELDEVVVQDVSDDALEQAAGAARGGNTFTICFTLLCGVEPC